MRHAPRLTRMHLLLATLAAGATGCASRTPFAGDVPPLPDAGITPAPRGYCTPRAVTRASELAPDLHAWILAAAQGHCHLDRRTSGGVVDGFPTALDSFPAPGTTSCDAAGCWSALPAFARAWSHVPPPAPFSPPTAYLGEKWTGTVRAARHQLSGEIRATLVAMEYGSSALRRYERRFDAGGRLLEDRHYFGEALWFVTTNSWAGGQLIASRFVDSINGTGETDYTWSYDGGRLARATATHLPTAHVGVAELTYDGAGRLASVSRTIDGQIWSRQEWSYADGKLVRSATELAPKLHESIPQLRAVDTIEPLITASNQREWLAARPLAATAGGCTELPHALTYGYPEADGVYALGWPVGDRPNGIDGDYGFGPAYDSALDRWFGHDRVEGIVWRSAWPTGTTRVVIDYDARGRMFRETLTTSDGSGDAVRTRVFDGERVTRDQRVLRRDQRQLTTELTFGFDGAGDLVARTYTMNGVLVARHTWLRAGGEITRHTIAQHPIFPAGLDQPGVVPEGLGTLPAELPPAIVHERGFSADGRTITIRRQAAVLETRTRDAAGRILSRSHPAATTERYTYEASGELRSYSSSTKDEAAVPDMLLAYDRGPDGRLLARRWSYYTSHSDTDLFSYVCE